MEIKFRRRLDEYNYILAFDLAKHKSGYALVDTQTHTLVRYGLVVVKPTEASPWLQLYNRLKEVVDATKKEVGEKSFFVTKERLPHQNGPRSSIAALQELAKAHAILDLLIAQENVDYYDVDGVAATSVKAYYKTLTGIDKPSKKDIFEFLRTNMKGFEGENADEVTFDVSDAIAVVQTLIGRKWNADIDQQIKEEKKKMKALTKEKDVEAHRRKIDFLRSLTV